MSESAIKTLSQLKEEWGLERYVPALGIVAKFCASHIGKEISVEEMKALMEESSDAWEVFCSLKLHGLES